LNQEVLDSLDDDRRGYVLNISVLGRFTAELCDDVLGRTDSASVLDELERSNLLVTRLEHGARYSVHPLFAEFAEFQLASAARDAPGEIHRRAAEWYDARSLPVEAVEHAAAAGDDRLVARVLSTHYLALLRSGRARMLLERARSLGDDQLIELPELAVAAATAAAMTGGLTIEQRRFLGLAEAARMRRPERFTPYVEAGIAMVRAT